MADLSFELRPGVTGLLGPNGAGKTTTLKAICGLLHPSQGEVLLFGRPIRNDPMLYRAIGVVPDGDRLYPRLTVRSYVRLHAELQGLTDAGAAAERAIAEVDMLARWPTGASRACPRASGSGPRWRGRSSTSRPCWCWTSR